MHPNLIVLLEIVEHFGQPNEIVIIGYGPGELIGEMGPLIGQSGVATSHGRIQRIGTLLSAFSTGAFSVRMRVVTRLLD